MQNRNSIEYKEKRKVWDRKFRNKNKLKRKLYEQNRRCRKSSADGVITKSIIEFLFYSQSAWCYYCLCDISNYFEIEHKTPLIRGGDNLINNLCLSCKKCNLEKGTKTEKEYIEWLKVNKCHTQ